MGRSALWIRRSYPRAVSILTGLAACQYALSLQSHVSRRSWAMWRSLAASRSLPACITGPQILLQLHSDASEVSGVSNGSIVTPAIAPPGFSGKVVVTGGGSVNFAPAQTGNGVYFLKCCDNLTNAYYKFSGATVGSIFNVNQGQISFYLKSRQSFAQRLASRTLARQVLDVRDANTHLFQFNTQAANTYLRCLVIRWGVYSVSLRWSPPGNGRDVVRQWGHLKSDDDVGWKCSQALLERHAGAAVLLHARHTPNWSATSNFDFGAYEDVASGGSFACDDIIDEFTVTGTASPAYTDIGSASDNTRK